MDVKIILVIALMLYATSEWKPVSAQEPAPESAPESKAGDCDDGQGCVTPCKADPHTMVDHMKCKSYHCGADFKCTAGKKCAMGKSCNPADCDKDPDPAVPDNVKTMACMTGKCDNNKCVMNGGGGGMTTTKKPSAAGSLTSSIFVTVLGLGVILGTYFK